jgi:hypothetical protein
MGQPQCLRHDSGSDGSHIIDSDHRIDRVVSGEFDHSLGGRLWMSNIE